MQSIEILITMVLVLIICVISLSVMAFQEIEQGDIKATDYNKYSLGSSQSEIEHSYKELFKTNCALCHRIDTKHVGPALAGITERREMSWIIKMVQNSSKLIASGDPTANKLYKEYGKYPMTNFSFLEEEEIRGIIDYVMKAAK